MRMIRTFALLAVALVVLGCGGEDATAERSNDLTIEAGDLYYEPEELAASPGEVTITMNNVGSTEHDLAIEELDDAVVIDLIAGGESATGSVSLDEGTYTLYCTVVGHREAGMETALDVG